MTDRCNQTCFACACILAELDELRRRTKEQEQEIARLHAEREDRPEQGTPAIDGE